MQKNEDSQTEQNAQANSTPADLETAHEGTPPGAPPQLDFEKKLGWENVANGLLDVLDNLDRALQFAKPDTDPQLMGGLKMTAQQFRATMEKQGVAEIPTEDQVFNHELHEAVGQLPSEKASGTIVQEQQKGYTLHGRLLRPSRVMISTGKAAN